MSIKISTDEWNKIQSEYRYIKNDNEYNKPKECEEYHDWRRVYKEGTDCKYGTIMVSDEMRAYRNPTFYEFYGDGVID